MSNHESESIRVTRVLPGSPDRVFNAWLDPSVLPRWLAPKAEVDAREGGHFRLEVAKPEGTHVVTGEYREFTRNERLVMTWVYNGPMAAAGEMEALLMIGVRKHGSNTELTLQHENLPILYIVTQSQRVHGPWPWTNWRRSWQSHRHELRR